jgi:hypothetical protein
MLTLVSRTATGVGREKPADIVRGEAARLSWAWDSLCFGVPFVITSHEGLMDAVTNARGAVKQGLNAWDAEWTRDNRGNTAISLPRDVSGITGRHVEWADNPTHDRPSTELTAMIRFKWLGGGSDEGGLFEMPHGLAAPWATWSMQQWTTTSGVYGSITINGTNTVMSNTGVALPTTEYVTAVLRWRNGEAPVFDILGERGNSISRVVHGSTLTGTLTYNTGKGLQVNASEGPDSTCAMNCSQALVWSRKLSDSEVTSLVADPFGWYAPRRESVLFAGPFPILFGPATVATVAGTSPYSGASIAPVLNSSDVATSYTVTAGSNRAVNYTRTISGVTNTDSVPAGTTQAFPTGATTEADVTYVALDSDDTGV